MFVTSEKNRKPPYAMPFCDEEADVTTWSAIEQLIPRDMLILRVSPPRSRVVPTIMLLDLPAMAPHLERLINGDVVLRGAAVLSTQLAREVDQWTLDPLSEIRVGVTEPEQYNQGKRLVSVTRFTTAAGRTFSVPSAIATRPARGRRLWRAKAPRTTANC